MAVGELEFPNSRQDHKDAYFRRARARVLQYFLEQTWQKYA